MSIAGFAIEAPFAALGLILGMTYGILAVGLVLVYRSSRIVNFAHGEVGAFAAAVLGLAVTQWKVPYWIAFPLALGVGAGVSAIAEIAVVRRLRDAPRLMSIVATLGVGQFLLLFSLVINTEARAGQVFPKPPFLPSFNVGQLLVTPAHVGMLVLTPMLVVALAVFLRRSAYGLAIRGSAANAEAARTAGIAVGRMSTLAWGIAGAVSAYTAVLFSPTRGFISGESFGPGLLLRALVAAVIARMTSIPVALVAGVGVGVVEQILLANYPRGGLVEAVLFVVILAALLMQRRTATARDDERGSWAAVQPWPPLPEAFRAVWAVRNLGAIVGLVALAIAAAAPLVVTNTAALVLTQIVAFSMVGLSVGVVTGLAGQLTLGQFAVAAVGAVVSYQVSVRIGNFFASFALAGLAAAAVAVLIGLPALRIKGLMLAVTTLSFALMAQSWLLQQPWTFGEAVDPGRPVVGAFVFDSVRKYYVLSLGILVLVFWLVRNIRGGAIGRRLVAVRDNEDNARAFTINATAAKLQGFAVAGFVAGIAGATYCHVLTRVSPLSFPVAASVNVVAMAVLGGIGLLAGPVIGALYIIGIPEFLPLDAAGAAATSFGWLLLILYVPGGVGQLIRPLRDRLVDLLARRGGVDPVAARAESIGWGEDVTGEPVRIDFGSRRRLAERATAAATLLKVQDIRKHFGGVHAVDGVSFTVPTGAIVGLIGPNGAGKTTTFELIAGFAPLDGGRIVYKGVDVSALRPEERGRLGLIRSFQDAALFPTMTVLDVVRLAQERVRPTRFARALVGLDRDERTRDIAARELLAAMGLDRYRNRQIGELSTGTRRITEIACLVALEPELVLLDEPSSGIAQRETEALGSLLADLRRDLEVTMLVIEHDIPLIMGLSDRVIAMDTGKVIAEGSPDGVRRNEQVIAAYLGGDLNAINRSGRARARQPDLNALIAAVPGVGPGRQHAIVSRFPTANALAAASVEDLVALPGIGAATARRLLAAVGSALGEDG